MDMTRSEAINLAEGREREREIEGLRRPICRLPQEGPSTK